ncbi:P-loop containing nucleoside triphosphate hydrolase protein [Scheffersomyces amazonensis]|uniref:P-loop containing nucleoside triphosphate hydrolase protein n=1 Tax=Scheffersomyces amazonensis TaxID=1078765 RepID=UPI00315DCD8B
MSDERTQQLYKRLALPLAEAIRPQTLSEYIGQHNLINSEDGAIWNFIRLGYLPSMILYGPPGVGKTTIASLIAKRCGYVFIELSATDATVQDLKDLSTSIEQENISRSSQTNDNQSPLKVVIFIDEIHRFSTTQQDFLLPYVENGNFVFIGATTINPQKRIRRAILSRCQIFKLELLSSEEIGLIVKGAILFENIRRRHIHNLKFLSYNQECLNLVITRAQGDTRIAIGLIELIGTKYSNESYQCIAEESNTPIELHVTDLIQAIKSLKYSLYGLQDANNIKHFKNLFKALKGTYEDDMSSMQMSDTQTKSKNQEVTVEDDEDEDFFLDDFKSQQLDDSIPNYEYLHQMQVSDDSDIEEEGDIYGVTESETKPIDANNVSSLEFFQFLAVFYIELLLKNGESPMFIGKQLVLFTILYTETDLWSLRKVLNQLKALKYSNADVHITLANTVEWIAKQPRLKLTPENDIRSQLQLLKSYHSRNSKVPTSSTTTATTTSTSLQYTIDYDPAAVSRALQDHTQYDEGIDQNPGFLVQNLEDFKEGDDINMGTSF